MRRQGVLPSCRSGDSSGPQRASDALSAKFSQPVIESWQKVSSRASRALSKTSEHDRSFPARSLSFLPSDTSLAREIVNPNRFCRSCDATRHLETAVALRPGDSNVLFNAACTFGVMGRKLEALEMLKKARDVGYGNWDWAARDPDLRCLYVSVRQTHVDGGRETSLEIVRPVSASRSKLWG